MKGFYNGIFDSCRCSIQDIFSLCFLKKIRLKQIYCFPKINSIVKVMTILSQAEFDQNAKSDKSVSRRLYQGKTIEAGPVFSLDSLKAAEGYCDRFCRKQHARICLVIQGQNFIRIWSEVAQENNKDDFSSESLKTETTISINALPLTSEFTESCQKLLAEQIGPIAGMICKKTLNKKPHLSRVEFVDILAKKISDPTQAQEFKQAALE